jgi:uncharacterized protein DUF4446
VELLVLFLLFLIALIFVWMVVIEYRLRGLGRSFRRLMTGRQGVDLEAVLMDHVARITRAEENLQAQNDRVAALEAYYPYQLQHASVVRFNPFGDKGGDQSFAIAVLDDHTDGFVLSCLHTRLDVKVYAKPIIGGQSTYTLTPEEKDAIARAMKPHA